LLCRIDIQIEVPTLGYQELASKDAEEPSSIIRLRVNGARTIQLQRFHKRTIHSNAQMGAKDIKRCCAVKEEADKLLEAAINKLGLSARAYSCVLTLIASCNPRMCHRKTWLRFDRMARFETICCLRRACRRQPIVWTDHCDSA